MTTVLAEINRSRTSRLQVSEDDDVIHIHALYRVEPRGEWDVDPGAGVTIHKKHAQALIQALASAGRVGSRAKWTGPVVMKSQDTKDGNG